LNNKPVGSAPIDDKVLGERQVTMKLPASDFKRGTYNQLSFEAVINIELPDCVLPELDLAWVRLNEQSQLYLPHTLVDSPENYATLEDALSPFISRQDLTDVWFSLPEQPTPAELAGLLKVAAWLGNFSRGPGFAPHVSRGAISDMAQVETYNIIAFGQPTTNPLIAMLNEQLPQPFVPGENTLRQQVGNVTYRLPERFSLGLLQTLLAPWNPKQVILIATGTTTEGVTEAIASLTNDDIYYELEGNVAFISQDRVESFESTDFIRGPLVDGVEKVIETAEITSEVALEVVPAPLTTTVALYSTTSITPAPAGEAIADRYFPATEDKPPFIEWLTIGLIGSGIFVAAVGGVVSWWKRSRSAKREY
jgi:hypothetical protein